MDKSVKIKSYAKVNLTLEIINKREDGYHNLETIIQSIDISDLIIIRERKAQTQKQIKIVCSHPQVPKGKKNLAEQAARLMIEETGIDKKIEIKIEKNIPLTSGLAGGSSNAAAVLLGLNKLWNLNLSSKRLRELGIGLGADIPFCLKGGTILVKGKGERLMPLSPAPLFFLVLIKPDFSLSTSWVYKNLDLKREKKTPSLLPYSQAMLSAIREGDVERIASNLSNRLESVAIAKYPVIAKLKQRLKAAGALGSLMSGSGPTVFGVFPSWVEAKKAGRRLNKAGQVFVVKTVDRGVEACPYESRDAQKNLKPIPERDPTGIP